MPFLVLHSALKQKNHLQQDIHNMTSALFSPQNQRGQNF
jgi:hypothetical protein